VTSVRQTIAVVDYGMGNLRSVAKALEHVAPLHEVVVTSDSRVIGSADRVILPGVGALRDCMGELRRMQLIDVVVECATSRPFLGICLGMQALLEFSEENDGTAGLGILPGRVVRFRSPDCGAGEIGMKIPHMGWSPVEQATAHPLWQDIANHSRFYFVHSYYVQPSEDNCIAGTTEYGVRFASALARGKLFAVQFHPEKSQRDGLQLLKNFTCWNGAS